MTSSPVRRVAIVGGGLAGLAAASALASRGVQVDLYEARHYIGGRAASYQEPGSDSWVDHCQHVSLGCCTNLADFLTRTGIRASFRREPVLHFFAPDGRRYDLRAARLPAPFHLFPSLLRLGYLTISDRWHIARTLGRLARLLPLDPEPTIKEWLLEQRATEASMERFWGLVLTSALSESLDRIGLAHARKVFVDSFMASRSAYVMEVPDEPLGRLYGDRVVRWLAGQGVSFHLGSTVASLAWHGSRVRGICLADGPQAECDAVIVATPWRRAAAVCRGVLGDLPELEGLQKIESAPITAVHLWFDRPLGSLAHAVLVGRLSQWVFQRPWTPAADEGPLVYYQVVVSASRSLAGRTKDEVVKEVIEDLSGVFPAARQARLVKSRIVTQEAAVFSVLPGIDDHRPRQRTSIENLVLAGDWTKTAWPATMEGAVRSGYLAAEAVCAYFGEPARFLVADLPRSRLAQWLCGPPDPMARH
jgi:squalene-associated FAD-dependent desaturase